MVGQWRLLNTGYRTGAQNMAIDEALLRQVAAGRSQPVVRFYGWSPPCVSLGYFQDTRKAVNLEACLELGVDYVRRPTGGRAVLHEHEVTYSLVVPGEHLPKGVTESYRFLSEGILRGLQDLGVPAKMVPGKKGSGPASAACFDAASWYEIAVDGRKLVGSAQVRQEGVVLQHGSILLRFDPERLAYLLSGDQAAASRLIQLLTESVADLEGVLGRRVEFSEVAAALSVGWEKTLGITLVPSVLTAEEEKLAQVLIQEKYGREEWNANRVKRRVD